MLKGIAIVNVASGLNADVKICLRTLSDKVILKLPMINVVMIAEFVFKSFSSETGFEVLHEQLTKS